MDIGKEKVVYRDSCFDYNYNVLSTNKSDFTYTIGEEWEADVDVKSCGLEEAPSFGDPHFCK